MRLTLEQIEAIKQTAHAVLGAESRVILFGSRTNRYPVMSLKYLPEHASAAQQACQMFFDILERAQAETVRLGVAQTGAKK